MKKIIFSLILCMTVFMSAFSQLDTVNIGTSPNSGNGDNLRVAFGKVNDNDQYLYNRIDSSLIITQSIIITITSILATAADTSESFTVMPGNPIINKNIVQLNASWTKQSGTALVTVIAQRWRSGVWNTQTSAGATFTGTSTPVSATINTDHDGVIAWDRIRFISTRGAGTSPLGVQCTAIYQ